MREQTENDGRRQTPRVGVMELFAEAAAVAASRRELMMRLRMACLEKDRDAVLALARVLTGLEDVDA